MTMCSAHVRKVPFFRNCDINFINAVLLELQYEVYQEGDIIIRQNTPGDRMFFIEHGQVLEENEYFQKELCDGDCFGGLTRVTLLMQCLFRPCSVVCVVCNTHVLKQFISKLC